MKKLILLLIISIMSYGHLYTQEKNNKTEFVKQLIEKDTESFNLFMKELSIWTANFYKYIQIEYLRNKYKKELNTDIKSKLKQLYNSKLSVVKEIEELYGEDAMNIILKFYDDWYENQLKSIELFNEFALIFDYCEFQYNPNSNSEMFSFYTEKCVEKYNLKIKEMYEIVDDDNSLKSKFESDFIQYID